MHQYQPIEDINEKKYTNNYTQKYSYKFQNISIILHPNVVKSERTYKSYTALAILYVSVNGEV